MNNKDRKPPPKPDRPREGNLLIGDGILKRTGRRYSFNRSRRMRAPNSN
jgi:hypothetical protein